MPKILLIDDDESLLKSLSVGLEKAGFQIVTAKDGPGGLKATFDVRPDLVILDVGLPGMDGLETCRRLRELSDTPIIMLTARAAEEDIVKGLTAGADDYLVKPFRMGELVARVETSLRHRSQASPGKASVLVVGDLTLDLARHKVTARSQTVDLSPTEFSLLSYLARNRGRVIPHRTLLLEVWGPEYANQIDYLHLYIRYLRKKIEKDPSKPEIVKTEWNVGYFIEE
jgi:two-component system, OmpR family, KDP operon response regulator KdpE